LIPRLLVRYRLKFPGIELRVEVEQSAAMTARLLEGQVDVALSEVPPMVDRFVARVFMRDPLVPIVPARHPLLKRKTIELSEFLKGGLIVREGQSPGESFLERELRRLHMNVQPILRVNSTEAAKEAVAAGLGVAIVSGLAVSAEGGRQRLAAVRLQDCDITRPLYVIRPTSGQPSKAAKAFLCMLDHAARGLLPAVERRGRGSIRR
jgi:DNA-binding transcriptional LysR family regulator